jgi:hypothetical protein
MKVTDEQVSAAIPILTGNPVFAFVDRETVRRALEAAARAAPAPTEGEREIEVMRRNVRDEMDRAEPDGDKE